MIQGQVLNYILETKDPQIITTNALSVEDFQDYPHEFNFIKDHLDRYGNVPDKVTFASIFPDFVFYDVSETPTYLLEELKKEKRRNKFISLIQNLKKPLLANDDDACIQLLDQTLSSINGDIAIHAVDIIHDTSRYDRYVDRCQNFDKSYFPTCFDELTEAIGGWDRKEELATIVARPGVGKSWVLLKCAVAVIINQPVTVGIYSGEMSEDKVAYRFDTLVGNIPNTGLIRGNINIQAEYKHYIDNLAKSCKGTIKILTPSLLGGRPAGVKDLRAFVEKENLDMLCVDQHSLLEDDRGARDPVSRASNISRDLKNLQVIKKIPIIAVS